MNLLPRAVLSAFFVVFASYPSVAQRTAPAPLDDCPWRQPVSPCLKPAAPPKEAGFSYAGGFAIAVGGLSLLTRLRRR